MEDTKELYAALLGIRHSWRVDNTELKLSRNRAMFRPKKLKDSIGNVRSVGHLAPV